MAWGFFFATRLLDGRAAVVELPRPPRGQTVSLQGRLARLAPAGVGARLWVVVLGSIVPFVLIVGALRHVSATRVGIAAMLEPVVATIVAWAWLARDASAPCSSPAPAVVLAAILLAQTAR